jgi:hypothetical protein
MKVNVLNLQEVIKKATLHNSIETVQIKVDATSVTSKMRSQNNNVVVILNLPNDILTDVPDTIELNFDKPSAKVLPYLNLIDNDIVEAKISDEKIMLKDGRHKTNLHFCMPSFVTTFTGEEPVAPVFYEINITEEILGMFKKILKIGGSFEKVYFAVRDKQLIIETTDRQNRFANGINFVLDSIEHGDLDICVDFKSVFGLFQSIKDHETEFKAKLVWLADQEAGMVIFEKNDQSERYYLLQKLENT